MNSNRWALLTGAIAGAVFTRIPYMEDGNLLTTTVLVVLAATFTLVVWKILKHLTKW
jgi:hypothetical protein